MKKIKQPGENFSLKTKKTEDPAVMAWINAQTNLMDSLRYLIENELASSGIRNLQTIIPAERTWASASPKSEGMPGSRPAGNEAFRETASAAAEAREDPYEPVSADPDLSGSSDEEEVDDEDIEAWQ